MKVIHYSVFLIIFSCSNQSFINSSDGSSESNSLKNDNKSLNSETDDLAKIYSQAISEFIKASYINDKTKYDTLFIGKRKFGQPDDFPEIELPLVIQGTQIRLVSPEEGQIKQKSRKSSVYINLIGWVDKPEADFLFVVFTNGFEHQYDYSIKFKFNSDSQEYKLDKVDYENYVLNKGKKPQLINIYKENKYVVDSN